MTLVLAPSDKAMLAGEAGPAAAFAFEILHGFAEAVGATSFIDISGAHIDGCLYHGQVSLDFVEKLIEFGGRVHVPTTLNVGSMDLIHPEIMRQPAGEKPPLARLMQAHEELGCMPSFTCAPYQTMFRPTFGQQIAWGESNAIVFANSVIGARTNRYGDFIDLCSAITGRVPAWGLHLDENRLGKILFRLVGFDEAELENDALYVGVGLIIGFESGETVPVIEGLPTPRDEDQLKALGAAAATSGAVGLFHAIGITPEAPTFNDAFGGHQPQRVVDITPADVSRVLARLSGVADGTPLTAVCFGTPHFSRMEWDRLLALLDPARPPRVPIYVNTGRETLDGLRRDGKLELIEKADIRVVTDTCTYLTAILERLDGAVMTNSGKWAHYAPSNIGVKAAFGTMRDCVASANAGFVVRLGAMNLTGKFYVSGEASAPALVLPAPLSFWGGVDPVTATIIDQSQSACGAPLAGKVLVMPSGRGSSSSSSVVAEVIRNRLGPVAFVMQRPDPIITAGAIVARSLYGIICPVVTTDISSLQDDMIISITVDASGTARIDVGALTQPAA